MSERATVLYVEDNEDNFRLVRRLLEATGDFRVVWAADGPSGLDLARELLPAVVLLDLDLPRLDGYELARRLRADPQLEGVPLIAISANVMRDEPRRAREAGCLTLVEKPIDIAAFRELIAGCVGA